VLIRGFVFCDAVVFGICLIVVCLTLLFFMCFVYDDLCVSRGFGVLGVFRGFGVICRI